MSDRYYDRLFREHEAELISKVNDGLTRIIESIVRDRVIELVTSHDQKAAAFIHKSLYEMEQRIMSVLDDKVRALKAAADAMVGRVTSDHRKLQQQVDELQRQVDAGGASQETLDLLDASRAQLDAIDPTNDATLPPDGGGSPAPAPTPAPPTDTGGGTTGDTAGDTTGGGETGDQANPAV